MPIPKIIHLTTKDKETISTDFQENLDIMKGYNQNYSFRVYDDNDINTFVSEYDSTYYNEIFTKLPKQIMRVDTVRYLWMEAFGGIYFDFAIRMQKAWHPTEGAVLIEREWTFPLANDITVSVHNCAFASTPKHPLWRHLLNGIARHVENSNAGNYIWPAVFDITGPNAISRTIAKERLVETLEDLHVLAPSFIYQRGVSKGAQENATVVHQVTGSWK